MNSLIQQQIKANGRAIKKACHELSVKRLRLFGSAAQGDFKIEGSDLDFIVEFSEPTKPGIADRFLSLANALETIFQRPVDLLTENSIRNPIFRKNIEASHQTVYEN